MPFIPFPTIAIGMGISAGGGPGGGGGGGAGGAPEIPVNAVYFDGSNDWLTRGDVLTGAVDNKLALISLWFFFQDDVAAAQTIYRMGPSGQVILTRASDLKLEGRFRSAASGSVWDFGTTATFPTAGGWTHCLIAVDAANSITQIFIDDAAAALDSSGFVERDIDWASSVIHFLVGVATTVPGSISNVFLAELYVTNEFLDISDESNRRKFISSGGKPVDLGSDGSDPTGTAPLIYLTGATATWHVNKGSGGGFTEVGALTDASSSPSD